jgi:hypothetical protein
VSYRSLLGPAGILSPETAPAIYVALLGGLPGETLSDPMRADVVASLRRGETVLLLSDRCDLRDAAKAEIMLAMAPAAGAA